jgi:hypothetical protein
MIDNTDEKWNDEAGDNRWSHFTHFLEHVGQPGNTKLKEVFERLFDSLVFFTDLAYEMNQFCQEAREDQYGN